MPSPAAVRHRERVLGRQGRGPRHTEALPEARPLDEPRRTRLDASVALGKARRGGRVRAEAVGHPALESLEVVDGEDRVREERPAAPRVVVGLVEHHAAPPALRQHSLAGLRQRHPVADGDPELGREVGVAHRLRQGLQDELEHHVDDDVAVGALEDGVAVGEAGSRRRSSCAPAGPPGPTRGPGRRSGRPPGRRPRRSARASRRSTPGCRRAPRSPTSPRRRPARRGRPSPPPRRR